MKKKKRVKDESLSELQEKIKELLSKYENLRGFL